VSNKPRRREHFPRMKVRGNNGRLREAVAAVELLQRFTERWIADLCQVSFERDARENGWAHAYLKRALMKNLHEKSPARYTIPDGDPYLPIGWIDRDASVPWVQWEDQGTDLPARPWLSTHEPAVVETKPQLVSDEMRELLHGIAMEDDES
jgi:hypothetical protein